MAGQGVVTKAAPALLERAARARVQKADHWPPQQSTSVGDAKYRFGPPFGFD
jgi:hypothetical protein